MLRTMIVFTGYSSTLYIGIAIVLVFSLYIHFKIQLLFSISSFFDF